ncbi:hypothetical protein ACFW9U_27925 [Rhodococcus aetherivorans]|uniref:hypothetical protein n=1 Tax=Rhodococcus aetherivorans TaxID=191292 RepID=UPI0036702811
MRARATVSGSSNSTHGTVGARVPAPSPSTGRTVANKARIGAADPDPAIATTPPGPTSWSIRSRAHREDHSSNAR